MSKKSHLLVRHHRWHTYAIIRIIPNSILTLYDNPYYLWHHMNSVHYITCIIYGISSTLYITFPTCVTSHNDSIYDIKHDKFMTYSLVMASHSVMSTQPLCGFTTTMTDITLSVFLTLHTMDQFYEKKWMYVITASICMTLYALHITSHQLFMTSHHFTYDVKSTISNNTSTLSDLTSTVSV